MTQLFNAVSTCSTGGSPPVTATGSRCPARPATSATPSCGTGSAGPRRACARPASSRSSAILMVMADSPHFVVVYLAAMRVGAIPVPVSTMLRADGIAELLRDSRARFLAVTSEFAAAAESAAAAAPELAGVLADFPLSASTRPVHRLRRDDPPRPSRSTCSTTWRARRRTTPSTTRAPTRPPSGSTPRARPARPRAPCTGTARSRWSARPTGSRCSASGPDDRCLSAAKAFFAYGLGNSVLFPLSAGAASVLLPPPSRPDLIAETAAKYGATLFFGGPTFFANMLRGRHARRRAVRGPARRLRGRGAARRAVRSGGPGTSASTSSTASG